MKTHLLLAAGLLLAGPALGQVSSVASPTTSTYEFLTVVEMEAPISRAARLLFAPSFQGKTQVSLEEVTGSADKIALAYQRNLVTLNQQLEAITAAGWELVGVTTSSVFVGSNHEYLFRRRKS